MKWMTTVVCFSFALGACQSCPEDWSTVKMQYVEGVQMQATGGVIHAHVSFRERLPQRLSDRMAQQLMNGWSHSTDWPYPDG